MLYAVIHGGQVVGNREIEDWDSYPEHKKEAKDEVGDGFPTLRPLVEEGEGPLSTYMIEPTQVRLVRSKPPLEVMDVKMEAQRRIIELTGARNLEDCLVKQSNIQMEVNYLNDKRLNGETLTEGEEQWAAWARNLRVQIKHIREKSNEVEALNPIPTNFADNSFWE